ncbi:hypothetical protein WICPIJ_003335 [Wickerhamomyces pijperi]|uniref:UBP-type domain-containing protein n=1 Tax=Wickerhamomyces pijperi TaxID=599730 RepID=A0A9P8QA46_WICPI|nr:hypothetical protein WICPIJ_003335 [Wickerhamomyces pijperi]
MTTRALAENDDDSDYMLPLLHTNKKLKTSVNTSTDYSDSTRKNMYLDTVNRKNLDFDFEKICCVTLSPSNVYCCLTCGKYFQGRSVNSPCFAHSINDNHHIFISFSNLKVYCLPENYEIKTSLDDIKFQINPKYSEVDVNLLQSGKLGTGTDLDGTEYTQSVIGMNNIKGNDYTNVILQALIHIPKIRDFFLLKDHSEESNELLKRFSIIVKKMYSLKLFRNHVSPHEILQCIDVMSKKKFTIGTKGMPNDFLLWFVNTLNSDTKIFSSSLQGKLEISTSIKGKDEVIVKRQKFWELNLKLPPVSVLKKEKPLQTSLYTLLEPYTNSTDIIVSETQTTRYKITKFPEYLVLNFNRFMDFNLNIPLDLKERNKSIVEFPFNLEFNNGEVKYKLISNVVHYEMNNQSNWKIQMNLNRKWYEIDNLQITEKEKEFLFLNETCLQIWRRVK